MDLRQVDFLLKSVEKPSRYTGGELNSIVKKEGEYSIHYAMCFPDIYEVGMSHIGSRILYDVFNKRSDTFCERGFMPWVDMIELMDEQDIKLFSLETKTPLNEFDFLGFTLQTEMTYTNIVSMMKLSDIPLFAKDRGESHPIIMAGGPCAFNVEPIADYFDIVILGDGEEVNNLILDEYNKHKKNGTSRIEFYEAIAHIQGVYIPAFYEEVHDGDKYIETKSINENAPDVVTKAVVSDMNTAEWPQKPIVPYLQLIHDRVTMEIFRGCTRGCRFCQAGIIYRPVREKSIDTLIKLAADNIKYTGYDEISLTSLSSGDYSDIGGLVTRIFDEVKGTNTTISLPSLRLDAHAKEYMQAVDMKRKLGLTLAPEAGSQRLRDVINKGVTEDDLIRSVKDAFENGFSSIKLYFMLGLPTETMEDVDAIARLAYLVRQQYYATPKELRGGRLKITVSTSCFIPKAHTPFQWYVQDGIEDLKEKQMHLKDRLKTIKGVTYNYHDAEVSRIEAVMAKGDRKLSKVIQKAYEIGCIFDTWSEHFDYEKWLEAFKMSGVNIDDYFIHEDNPNFTFKHLSCGVSFDFLKREWDKSMNAETTVDCREKCVGCGVNNLPYCNTENKCVFK